MTRPIFFRLQDELAEVKAERDRLADLLAESERWMGKQVIPVETSPFRAEVRAALEARRTPTGDGGTSE